MVTGAQRSHGEGRPALRAYTRAMERAERREGLIRAACGNVPGHVLNRLAMLFWEAVQLTDQISAKHFGNLDADGDWITRRG